jgi:hypothetical protein
MYVTELPAAFLRMKYALLVTFGFDYSVFRNDVLGLYINRQPA